MKLAERSCGRRYVAFVVLVVGFLLTRRLSRSSRPRLSAARVLSACFPRSHHRPAPSRATPSAHRRLPFSLIPSLFVLFPILSFSLDHYPPSAPLDTRCLH